MSTNSVVTLRKRGQLNKTLERKVFVNGRFVQDTAYNDACAKNAHLDLATIFAKEAVEPKATSLVEHVKDFFGMKL